VANRIVGAMQQCHDGGGIYTLGDRPGSRVARNLVSGQRTGNALYHDNGSGGFTTTANVLLGPPTRPHWLCINFGPPGTTQRCMESPTNRATMSRGIGGAICAAPSTSQLTRRSRGTLACSLGRCRRRRKRFATRRGLGRSERSIQ